MPSNAENYFNQIVHSDDPVAFLNSQANGVFEEEWLDFKGQPNSVDSTLGLWGKAVTGFSNTEGGVLVWGINAREKANTKLDCSCGLDLIKNPLQLYSLLTKNISTATTPPTNGIQIKSFAANEDGHGFVVCFIPEGKAKPYRSGLGEKYYFIRSGTSFNDANLALLRLMFYPKQSPDLQLSVNCKWNEHVATLTELNNPPRTTVAIFVVNITNAGWASAEHVYVSCQAIVQDTGSTWRIATNRWRGAGERNGETSFWFPDYLHPSQSMDAVLCDVRMPATIDSNLHVRPKVGIEFHFTAIAKDMTPRKFKVKFDRRELLPGKSKQAVIVES